MDILSSIVVSIKTHFQGNDVEFKQTFEIVTANSFYQNDMLSLIMVQQMLNDIQTEVEIKDSLNELLLFTAFDNTAVTSHVVPYISERVSLINKASIGFIND